MSTHQIISNGWEIISDEKWKQQKELKLKVWSKSGTACVESEAVTVNDRCGETDMTDGERRKTRMFVRLQWRNDKWLPFIVGAKLPFGPTLLCRLNLWGHLLCRPLISVHLSINPAFILSLKDTDSVIEPSKVQIFHTLLYTLPFLQNRQYTLQPLFFNNFWI